MPLHFRPLHLSFACTLLLGTLGANAHTPPAPLPPTERSTKADPAHAQAMWDAALFYEVLLSEMSASQGDMGNATELMLKAARDARSEQLYRRATELSLQSRSGPRALTAAQEWKASFPTSRDANRYVLQILLALNRVSDTLQPLQQEVQSTPATAKPAAFLSIAQLYSRVSDKALAAAVVEQALGADLQNPETAPAAWATVGHLRAVAGQKVLALDAARQSHTFAPDNGAAALLALELMESGLPDAEPLVVSYLQHQPSATIRLAYARVLIGYERMQDARAQLEAIIHTTPEFGEAWMVLAGVQLQAGTLESAQRSLQYFIALSQRQHSGGGRDTALSQAYLMQANIALQQRNEAAASDWLDKIEDDHAVLNVQSMRATILARQGKLTAARALIEAVPTRSATQEKLKRRAMVQLLRNHGAVKEAYRLQQALLAQAPEDNDMAYETAILADRAGDYAQAETLLRAIIARQPSYHHAYNALGYSFAERGVHLQEAQSLIQQALALAPDDPFILDSLGWVKFQQGQHSEAVLLLEKAYGLRNDAEIGTHLGEVLWHLGEQARARHIWQQSWERDPFNEVLRDTLKRLGVKL